MKIAHINYSFTTGGASTKNINNIKLLDHQKNSLIYYLRKYRGSNFSVTLYLFLHLLRKLILKVKQSLNFHFPNVPN